MADDETQTATTTFAATVRALLGDDAAAFDGAISLDEGLAFEVFVPVGAADTPPGVLVYISPRPSASMPPGWRDVMQERNLVWVGANGSGNEVPVGRRVELALLAAQVAAAHVDVDESRVYLSGFSGGGRVASMMIPYYPHVFRGAIFICGANPLGFVEPHVVAMLTEHRFVFLTGSGDFNQFDSQLSCHSFQAAGLDGARITVVDGLEHALPDAPDLADAVRWLDGATSAAAT